MRPDEYKIPKEKLVLANENKKLKDKELVTKPVGYLKDAFYRFSRNKGALVGAIIIGVLILYAILAPIISPYYVTYEDTYFRNNLPKLFNSEKVDFLDGCSNKKQNEQTFLYYYAMGAETGHNSIKRQEYTRVGEGEDAMYEFRLDSYQLSGTVFVTMTKDRYRQVQEYQDANNVQIIYPITDPNKRPQSPAQNKDANYWYETVVGSGNKTDAVNYKFNDDGSVTFNNIYLPYSIDELASKTNIGHAKIVQVFEKEAGYAVGFINEDNTVDYIVADCERSTDTNFISLENDFNAATVLTYDSAHKTFTFEINGHTDDTLDGTYFLGISNDTGSRVQIIDDAELSLNNYVPMALFSNATTQAETPVINTNYYLTFSRSKEETSYLCFGGYSYSDNTFAVANSMSKSVKPSFVNDGGRLVMTSRIGINLKYVQLAVESETLKINFVDDIAQGSTWEYDSANHTIKSNISDFVDASKNGDYYFYINSATNKIGLATLSTINADSVTNRLLALYKNSTTEATSLSEGDSYYFMNITSTIVQNLYYANGQFTGDNYHSKMRVEGDTPTYSYARPTQNGFETRVNYYEYYVFMHKEVIKDGIKRPFFIFGTNAAGKDIFTCLASGARFSFLFAIAVESVNMIVGAIYGAIEGYYGGKTDLIMERIVEILSAVPFMIVITLLKYHMNSSPQVLILFIAFFATGWIGMSGTVRMQFYRFKNQEYVLAARTLGARDWRIMFKHIFPNSLGTIVTSSVLVIPGMIFSETSLSYLGIINLESGRITSVGTLLAAGQPYLVSFPHMILFPAIFISLLMLCFNLFGNGLRDAFNPSLRGTED